MSDALVRLPIRQHLVTFFMSVSILSVLLFGYLLGQHFVFGLEDSVRLRLLAEWRSYQEIHQDDPNAPLPKSHVVSFHRDQLPEINIDGIDVLAGLSLKDDQFVMVFIDEQVTDSFHKEGIVGVSRFRLNAQQVVYGIARFEHRLISDVADSWFESRAQVIILIGVVYILAVLLVLWGYNHRLRRKTEKLVDWSEWVSSRSSTETPPDFGFDEYNRVAQCLSTSIRKNTELLQREQKFLSHASHELRTPVAIISANLEILELTATSANQHTPLARITRASDNMKRIIETMLWLVRKSDTPPMQAEVAIPALLDGLLEDHGYLLSDRDVSVIKEYDVAPTLRLPVTPFRVVVSNLVRNAFQYTYSGTVTIGYYKECVVVENRNLEPLDTQLREGFGFGHDLTAKICQRFGWRLDTQETDVGYIARLSLCNISPD